MHKSLIVSLYDWLIGGAVLIVVAAYICDGLGGRYARLFSLFFDRLARRWLELFLFAIYGGILLMVVNYFYPFLD
jgi:hypothetical protein